MTDTLTKAARSKRMSLIRAKDTGPERYVRRLIHSLGYRFRLHGRGMPGRPDLVFSSRRAVIFVHGCFWHQHKGCNRARIPKSHRDYWLPKLIGNKARDEKNAAYLIHDRWRVLAIWECELAHKEQVTRKIIKFLNPKRTKSSD